MPLIYSKALFSEMEAESIQQHYNACMEEWWAQYQPLTEQEREKFSEMRKAYYDKTQTNLTYFTGTK